MTNLGKVKQAMEEMIAIAHDLEEIREMVMGNEKIRREIEALIDDVKEMIKLLEGDATNGRAW